MKKKTYQLGVRMDEDLLARLRRFEEQTGISSSALARATLESALDYFESEKEIVFPLCCVPRKSVIPPPHFVNFFAFPREIFYAPRERFFSPRNDTGKSGVSSDIDDAGEVGVGFQAMRVCLCGNMHEHLVFAV